MLHCVQHDRLIHSLMMQRLHLHGQRDRPCGVIAAPSSPERFCADRVTQDLTKCIMFCSISSMTRLTLQRLPSLLCPVDCVHSLSGWRLLECELE